MASRFNEYSPEAQDIKRQRAKEIFEKEGFHIGSWIKVHSNIEATDWMLGMFYGLALKTKNVHVGEIGVRGGTSTIAFLMAACAVNGTVWSVDIEECAPAKHNITSVGLDPWWSFTQADSRTHNFPKPLDILFIDGDHSYEGVMADYKQHVGMVKEGGTIFFHDAINAGCPGMPEAIAEIGATVLPFGKAGLGFIVK